MIISNNLILRATGDGYGAVLASESEYVSYNNNTSVCIRMVSKKLELIFDYMPLKKTYILLPVKYNSTQLTMRAISKNDMLSSNIFIYHLKKNYFEFNQYLFYKNSNN